MIINEKWASQNLSKHYIYNIVVLTDGTSDAASSLHHRFDIPRYTSAEVIFNHVRNVSLITEDVRINEGDIIDAIIEDEKCYCINFKYGGDLD